MQSPLWMKLILSFPFDHHDCFFAIHFYIFFRLESFVLPPVCSNILSFSRRSPAVVGELAHKMLGFHLTTKQTPKDGVKVKTVSFCPGGGRGRLLDWVLFIYPQPICNLKVQWCIDTHQPSLDRCCKQRRHGSDAAQTAHASMFRK